MGVSVAILFFILWIIAFQKIEEKIIRKKAASLLKKGDKTRLLGKKIMLIGENGNKIIGENFTEMIPKEIISDIGIYDDMILIFLIGYRGYFIPTRYLTGENKEQFINKLMTLK